MVISFSDGIKKIGATAKKNFGLDGVLSGGSRSRKRNNDMSDEERESRKKSRHIKEKLKYSSGEYSSQVLVCDGSTVSFSARNAGHRQVKQVTKWKSLDPDTVRICFKANPGFIDKHRGKWPRINREEFNRWEICEQQILITCAFRENNRVEYQCMQTTALI